MGCAGTAKISLRTSPQTGVAIPLFFRVVIERFLPDWGIPTPVFALARKDMILLIQFCLQCCVLLQHLGGIGGAFGIQPGGKRGILYGEDLGA